MTTIPDHVGREAVRLLNDAYCHPSYSWPKDCLHPSVITVAKLLMNPPAPMTDPDEEAAKRVIGSWFQCDPNGVFDHICLTRATEQMRREREAWEAGR
jgi:hypothetical protein